MTDARRREILRRLYRVYVPWYVAAFILEKLEKQEEGKNA